MPLCNGSVFSSMPSKTGRLPLRWFDPEMAFSISSSTAAIARKVFESGSTYPLGGRRITDSKPPSPHSAALPSFTSTVAWRNVAHEASPVCNGFAFHKVPSSTSGNLASSAHCTARASSHSSYRLACDKSLGRRSCRVSNTEPRGGNCTMSSFNSDFANPLPNAAARSRPEGSTRGPFGPVTCSACGHADW